MLSSRVAGIDTVNLRDYSSKLVAGQIFEPLYQYHFLERPYRIIPLLAEDMPQITNDDLTYTIKIKPSLYYQDDPCFTSGKGRQVKADDFIFALKRIANVKSVSPNWSVLRGRIVGLDDFRQYTKSCDTDAEIDYSRNVRGLRATDDNTLVITLTGTWPQLLTVLADPMSAPVARETVDYYGQQIINHPVGTGPFMLGRWNKGSFIELVRNNRFRGQAYPSQGEHGDREAGYLDDAGKIMPFADRIIWKIITEPQPAWLLFLQGGLDSKVIPKDNFDAAIADNGRLTEKISSLDIKLLSYVQPSVYWLGFNMRDAVVGNNKPLRLAVSKAIDRNKFIDLFFNGRHLLAHGLIPPGLDAYDPGIEQKGYARCDIQNAKKLLEEAQRIYGGEIPTLSIAMPGTNTWMRQYGQFLARQLSDIGLRIRLDYMDMPTFEAKKNTADFQMFASGMFADSPDTIDWLAMFYSKNRSPGQNCFNYSNPDFDRLYEQGRTMFDSRDRRRLCRLMELIVLEDCPAVFINHRLAYALYHGWYRNYKPHAFGYGLAKYRNIDTAKRDQYEQLLKKAK